MILRMAWRNTRRNPRRTAIVALSVAVGIAGCGLSMALNLGLVQGMVDTAIATGLGHIQIHAPGYEADPEIGVLIGAEASSVAAELDRSQSVEAWSARVRGEGLVSSPRASSGVRVIGVDPQREGLVSLFRDSVIEGDWLGAEPRRALIGRAMAKRLQVRVGSRIVVSVQDLEGELTGQAFRVGGLIDTPSRELDENVVLLAIDEARGLFALGQTVSEFVVVARDDEELAGLVEDLEGAFGEVVEIRTWMQLAPMLIYMVDSFDAQALVVYAAVFVAMAFGIANVLLMSIYERTREIGMMLAIGMHRRALVGLVVTESIFVTLLGLLAGLSLAVLGVWLLADGIDMSLFSASMEALAIGNRIFPVLRANDIAIPLLTGLVTALISSIWPAVRASRGAPADALRHVG